MSTPRTARWYISDPRAGPMRRCGELRIANLKIAGLRWCDGGEKRAIRLEIEQRCCVQTVKPPHHDGCALDPNKLRYRRRDRVRPPRRSKRKGTARRAIIRRALQQEIAPGQMQPTEHFDPLILLEA